MAVIVRYETELSTYIIFFCYRDAEGKGAMRHLLQKILVIGALLVYSNGFAAGEILFERKLGEAEQGDAEAQYDVGYRYEKGRGIDEDHELAFSWYQKAAEQGLDKAQYKVGIYYMEGQGVDEDPHKAKDWLQKSANQGYPPAQYQLGKFYANSDDQNYELALDWLHKARDNGYTPATKEIRKVKRKLQ